MTSTGTARRVKVGGPWFEDFFVGQLFDDAPSLTVTTGHCALHHALFGDRLRLPLDSELSRAVIGRDEPLVHPCLVTNIAIGQSTEPSQRVRGNLFYRGLVLRTPVLVGDTLTTRTEVVGLKQNAARAHKPATGLVVLRVRTENQRGEPVLDFRRCPMIPLRDAESVTGHADDLEAIPTDLAPALLAAAVPETWRLDEFAARVAPCVVTAGTTYEIEGRDTITAAPELVRATLNMAAVHTDPAVGAYGRRLVYGGHVISMAAAHITRALPGLVTIIGWHSCDHTGPVFEGDILRTEVTVVSMDATAHHTMVRLHAVVFAESGGAGREGGQGKESKGELPVLDWKLVAVLP